MSTSRNGQPQRPFFLDVLLDFSVIRRPSAFSLIEVAISIGIVSVAILAVISLLPVGLQLARNSTEEIQAMDLISAISSDLKETPPAKSASASFNLEPLPWQQAALIKPVMPNMAIKVGTDYTFYFDDGQTRTDTAAGARFRVTLRYTRVPGIPSMISGDFPPTTSSSPVEALLVVSWPPSVAPVSVSSSAPIPQGQLETYLGFIRP